MIKCLVTGHKGYIGSHLYAALKDAGHLVRGIDLKDGEDILDGLEQFEQFKPDYIFHLAAMPRVEYTVKEPVYTNINNIIATSIVLKFAHKVGARRVIFSSSSSVVGNGDGPTSPYGLQKLTSEMECKLYSQLYDVDTASLRYFNVYSEDQEADGPYATAVANWMKYIKEGKEPFITGDGHQRRDMLHVSDAVSANIFAMEHKDRFDGKHFDVGTGSNISLNQMKELVQQYFDIDFQYVEHRAGDVTLTCADPLPLEELGWKAEIDIREGVDRCFEELSLLYPESGFENGR